MERCVRKLEFNGSYQVILEPLAASSSTRVPTLYLYKANIFMEFLFFIHDYNIPPILACKMEKSVFPNMGTVPLSIDANTTSFLWQPV